MRKALAILAIMVVTSCSHLVTAVAEQACRGSYANAQAAAQEMGYTARVLSAEEARQVQAWYNAIEPVTDYVLSRVVVYSSASDSVVFLVAGDDCIVNSGHMTYDDLMARVHAHTELRQRTLAKAIDRISEVFADINRRGGIAAIGR